MSEILEINGNKVKIGLDSGKIVNVPIASVHFPDPKVGDNVKFYKDSESIIVKRVEGLSHSSSNASSEINDRRHINKMVYILVTFFLGVLGVHRFLRGQIGIGVVMLFFGWLTFGLWWLIDFIISLAKLSAYSGDDYIFTPDGRWAK